jgi:hypothetical protein
MVKWRVGLSRQTSRDVNHKERHIYDGVWPCCDIEERRMERVDKAHEAPWKRQSKFDDEFSPTLGG